MRVDEITEQREQLNEWVPIAIWGGRILYTALGRLGAKQFIKKYGKKSYDWVQKQTKKPETVKSNPVKPNLKAVDKLPIVPITLPSEVYENFSMIDLCEPEKYPPAQYPIETPPPWPPNALP